MDKEKLEAAEPKRPDDKGSIFAAAKDESYDVGAARSGTDRPGFPAAHAAGESEGAHVRPSLPVAEPFQGFGSNLPKERIGVFSQLVGDEGDITGLVAYSIYKQNKLDWLSAFGAAKGRDPTEDELASYIIGEGTPRRLATYRHLAEATLAGSGPTVHGTGQGPAPRASPRVSSRIGPRRTIALGDNPGLIATYAIIALLFLIGLLLAAHYTMSTR